LIATVTAGYLLGSLPAADVAGRLVGMSPRSAGTGNPGALNATALLGVRWGAAVGVVDVAKGWAAAVLGARVSPNAAYASATAAVLGHVFPPWSRFHGGKGVATSYGAVLGAFPAYAVPDLAVATVAARLTGDPRRATHIASAVWTGAALLWWRRRLPNLWGPDPTVGLPVSAALISALIAWRMRRPDRVRSNIRPGNWKG